jgi:hypothetical protein
MALRVVSEPAANSSKKKLRSSASDSGRPPAWSGRALTMAERMSSLGWRRFSSQHHADRLQRRLAGEPGDEVERRVLGKVVNHSGDPPAQLGLQRRNRVQGEALHHHAAQHLVFGIVGRVQRLAGRRVVVDRRSAHRPVTAGLGGEGHGVVLDRLDIGMAADHPEALAVRRRRRRFVPEDRVVVPQPGEVGVRKAVGEGLVARQVQLLLTHGLGLNLATSMPASASSARRVA